MRRTFYTLNALATAFLLNATSAAAQQHEHQHPVVEKLGSVQFNTSCSPQVTPAFNRAVALLHSFEFGASIRAFNDVLAQDPNCGMAHWGLALNHWNNPMAPGNRAAVLLERGRTAADAATRLTANATDRERDYAAAVAKLYADYETRSQQQRVEAYEEAMAALAAKYPDDVEAQIFYALAVAGAASLDDKTYARQLKAGELLERLFASMPHHPGVAHYIIHSYDYPPLAARAAAAAQQYAEIAPSAAHALHMPSHTFTRIGSWHESAGTNVRSMEEAARSGSWSEVLHAADYRVYAYMQVRDTAAAKAILEELPAIEAKFDVSAVTGAAPGWAGVFALAAMPARYAVERRAWREAANLPLTRDRIPQTDAITWFARALGAASSRDGQAARTYIDSLSALAQRLTARNETYWAEQVGIQRLAAEAWLDFNEGRRDDALSKMRMAADREEATEKSAVSPGPLAPSRELLGDMLMELKRPVEALAEYRKAQEREPNRYHSLAGAMRAAAAVGDRVAQRQYATRLATLTGRKKTP